MDLWRTTNLLITDMYALVLSHFPALFETQRWCWKHVTMQPQVEFKNSSKIVVSSLNTAICSVTSCIYRLILIGFVVNANMMLWTNRCHRLWTMGVQLLWKQSTCSNHGDKPCVVYERRQNMLLWFHVSISTFCVFCWNWHSIGTAEP